MAAAEVNLSVEVHGDDIVVTLPGTSYVVTYYRAAAFPQQLLTKSHSGREDEGAPMTQAEFHARAWKAASHKARALGWIEWKSVVSKATECRTSTYTGSRHRRHNARHQLEGSVPKATPRFAARGETRLFSGSAEGPDHAGGVSHSCPKGRASLTFSVPHVGPRYLWGY